MRYVILAVFLPWLGFAQPAPAPRLALLGEVVVHHRLDAARPQIVKLWYETDFYDCDRRYMELIGGFYAMPAERRAQIVSDICWVKRLEAHDPQAEVVAVRPWVLRMGSPRIVSLEDIPPDPPVDVTHFPPLSTKPVESRRSRLGRSLLGALQSGVDAAATPNVAGGGGSDIMRSLSPSWRSRLRDDPFAPWAVERSRLPCGFWAVPGFCGQPSGQDQHFSIIGPDGKLWFLNVTPNSSGTGGTISILK